MKANILDVILSKYARKGKYTRAGAKDVRLLCKTINSLMLLNERGCSEILDNEISAIMLTLEQAFLGKLPRDNKI